MLLRAENVSKRVGARTLFADVSFHVNAGDRLGLVGPNGAGKSTLLRILAGDDPPDTGKTSRPRDVRIGMLRQEIDPGQSHSVREEAAKAMAELDVLEAELRALEAEMTGHGERGEELPAVLAERYDRTHHAFELGGGFGREARVAEVLDGLGFDDEARERPLRTFSGGWLMRVELAKLLLAAPDVLLLDEPTNHLDLPAIQWFEETITSFRGALIVVSHDRTFLRKHVNRVAELDGAGRFDCYEGSYDRYLEQRAQRHSELLARKAKQDREIAQMERFVERFRAKSSKARQAQSRIKALERMERIEIPREGRRHMRMRIPPPTRTGETVLALEGVHKRYGDQEVYRGVDFTVRRGERVALVGPNGAGKSTLLRICAGVLSFESGDRVPGHNVDVAFYAQHQLDVLDSRRSVLGELERGAQMDDVPRLRGHLGAFLFSGDDVDKKVSVLSGGEKARLALAKLLLRPANFLVLDEPTNHLDIESCEILEEALGSFPGTFVFVSHDRSFINTLANKVVEVDGGQLLEFPGNYDDYLVHRERVLPAEPDRGTRPPDPSAATPVVTAKRLDREERRLARERRKTAERLGRSITRLEAEILEREEKLEALGWKLGDPAVYREADQVRTLEAERSALQTEVAERYREWERLADELAAVEDAAAGDPGRR